MRLKSSNVAEFESDLLNSYEDLTPQSHEILQTFVWYKVDPNSTVQNATLRRFIVARFKFSVILSCKLGKFTNLETLRIWQWL